MKTKKQLPEELVWSGEHASEIAIVALADAQLALVPDDVSRHVETCEVCSLALADATMLSLATADALHAMPEPERVSDGGRSRAPLPWRMLGVAMGLATFGLVPALLDARGLSGSAVSLVRSAPIVMKGLRQAAQSSGFPLWMTLGSALLLVVVSVALTRALPSPASRRIES
jgi:hypothetical protein